MMKLVLTFLALILCASAPTMAEQVDQGDGTVWDSSTGLMWTDSTNPGKSALTWGNDTACTGDPATETDALCYCDSFTLGPYADWRLPDRNELLSIVDYSRENPPVDPVLGVVAGNTFYWTSTSSAQNPATAWFVHFTHGGSFPDAKSNLYPARCVRGRVFQVDATNTDTNITVSDATDGINWVDMGSSQAVTFTADSNYNITNVIVDGMSLGPQTSPYAYTFTDVKANHVITAISSAIDEDIPSSGIFLYMPAISNTD